MVVDFFKGSFRIGSLPDLDFTQKIKHGEILTEEAKFCRPGNERIKDAYLTFTTHRNGWCTIHGSLHKYWHGNNYSDLPYTELVQAVSGVCGIMGVSPDLIYLTQLEFAVNISYPAKKYLDNLIGCKRKPYNHFDTGDGKRSVSTDWQMKAYDKAKQYRLNYNLLRIERKVLKGRYLERIGIKTLADLMERDVFGKMIKDIDQMLDDTIVDNPINEALLKSREKNAMANYKNPRWWIGIPKQSAQKAKGVFYKYKSRYSLGNLIEDEVRALFNAKAMVLWDTG